MGTIVVVVLDELRQDAMRWRSLRKQSSSIRQDSNLTGWGRGAAEADRLLSPYDLSNVIGPGQLEAYCLHNHYSTSGGFPVLGGPAQLALPRLAWRQTGRYSIEVNLRN
jgi:hypothetical protein